MQSLSKTKPCSPAEYISLEGRFLSVLLMVPSLVPTQCWTCNRCAVGDCFTNKQLSGETMAPPKFNYFTKRNRIRDV